MGGGGKINALCEEEKRIDELDSLAVVFTQIIVVFITF